MLAAALSACVTTGAGGGLHTPVSLGSASELAQTLNHVFQPRPSPDDGLRRATRVADGELDDESAAPVTRTRKTLGGVPARRGRVAASSAAAKT